MDPIRSEVSSRTGPRALRTGSGVEIGCEGLGSVSVWGPQRAPREAPKERMNRNREIDRRNLIGCAFILAMMAAPFIALLYGFGVGLAVLTLGLLLTAGLAFDARNQVAADQRGRVLIMAVIALGLALVTGLAAVSQFR